MSDLLHTKISINALGMLIILGITFGAGILALSYWYASVLIMSAAFGYGMFLAWKAK